MDFKKRKESMNNHSFDKFQNPIITEDEYKSMLTPQPKELMPITTSIHEWMKITNLPKVLAENLYMRISSMDELQRFFANYYEEKEKKPIVISTNILMANHLIKNNNNINMFFGGRWTTLCDIRGMPISFNHEGILHLCPGLKYDFTIIDIGMLGYEVLLGYNFQYVENPHSYVMKWGGPITHDDIKKRNRDLYRVDINGITLLNCSRDCE